MCYSFVEQDLAVTYNQHLDSKANQVTYFTKQHTLSCTSHHTHSSYILQHISCTTYNLSSYIYTLSQPPSHFVSHTLDHPLLSLPSLPPPYVSHTLILLQDKLNAENGGASSAQQEMESQVSMMEDVLLLGGKKTKTDDDDEDDDDDGSDKDVVVVMGGGKGGDVDRGNGLDDTEDDEENDENDDQEGMDEEKEGGSEDRPSKRSGLKIPLDWWRYKSEKQAEEDEDDEMLGRALLQGDLIKMGSKVVAFLGLLAHAVNCGDKVLCFSQSLPTLEFLEMVLGSQGWGNALQLKSEEKGLLFSKWTSGHQFLKITGQTNGDERQRLIHQFNDKVGNESSLQLIYPIHTLSIHPINAISTPYQYTLSTHPINPPYQPTCLPHPRNPSS